MVDEISKRIEGLLSKIGDKELLEEIKKAKIRPKKLLKLLEKNLIDQDFSVKENPSNLLAPVRLTNKTEDGILYIPKIDLEQLLEEITVNYHEQRPKILEIRGLTIYNDLSYSLKDAARALGIKESILVEMSNTLEILLLEKNNMIEIPGYEIFRIEQRFDEKKLVTETRLSQILYIGRDIIEILKILGVLEESSLDTISITGDSAARFYDEIFPKMDSDRYSYIMGLLEQKVG